MIYADEILKKDDSADGPKLSDRTIGTATGAIIGLAGGLAFAYFKDRKYLPCALIGTVAGGIITAISLLKK